MRGGRNMGVAAVAVFEVIGAMDVYILPDMYRD